MVSSSASALLRLAAWAYVPDFATRVALNVLHNLSASVLGIASPPPRTPQHARNYRYTFAIVILGYLAYNLLEAWRSTPSNFYQILGVTPDSDEGQLKQAFRSFAKKNHPDRVGPEGEDLFIQVRDAYDALKDPVTRFAYDRFGPDALHWEHCSTIREYMRHGLMHSAGFHVVSGAILLAMSVFGGKSPVTFWRFILYLSLFLSELALVLGPPLTQPSAALSDTPTSTPLAQTDGAAGMLGALFPQRVPYQHVLLLHQLFMFASVAVTRVAPVLFPPGPPGTEGGVDIDARMIDGAAEKLLMLGKNVDQEMTHMTDALLHSLHPSLDSQARFATMRPFPISSGDAGTLAQLRAAMETFVLESRLRREAHAPGPLRTPWEAAVKRAEVPPRRVVREDGEVSRKKRIEDALPSPVSRGGTPAPPVRLGPLMEAGEPGYVRARSRSW